MNASTSFTARRPAATGLPAFTLPPPPDIPRVSSDGLSPLSSAGVNSSSSHNSQGGGGGSLYAYPHMSGHWPTPGPGGNSSYTFSSAAGQGQGQGSLQPQQQQPFGSSRPLYSPSISQFPGRSSQSPAGTDGLPTTSPYGQELPSFGAALAGNGGSSHGALGGQQSAGQQLQNPILNSQNPGTQPPTPNATTAPDSYSRAPPTPSYAYPPSSTPQQPSFSTYSQPSPTQPSPPTGSSVPGSSRGPLPGSQHSSGMAPPIGYGASSGARGGPPPPQQATGYPPPPYHHLSGVAGPVMSNIGNPGGQMALVSGGVPGLHTGGMGLPPGFPGAGHQGGHHLPQLFGSSHAAAHHMQQQERPFRCDTCPQSFNRNHDLKRHQRIHLAVKPYPCTFCDKAFSRKDALKRHRLVKGCGSKSPGDTSSPPPKSEAMSDGSDGTRG
ncbi:hypothetical protein NKR23_g1716 [Pleurostoma richardsiae]|uniref:C2H2-type domain-containing protein n=1 Tax=Pleurostoma richardsiae TaxID=41990 RepID=A0AA38VW89_9PEZI|nr:hypothetical protein NKR23_g1716 [Pleurostoma richardsiae]